MTIITGVRRIACTVAATLFLVAAVNPAGADTPPGEAPPTGASPAAYAVQFIATAASAIAMNANGDVAGTAYVDNGCGSFCLPPQETVVWRGGRRIVLPQVPGLGGVYVTGINAAGWVSGLAGFPGTVTHAVVWKPTADTYTATDLGVLPGFDYAEAIGIDDQGRAVGWSGSLNIGVGGVPFMWSEATGMVDLAAQGFPHEPPEAVSRGGAVATVNTWYRLGDPASIAMMPPAPAGLNLSADPMAVNDAGEQARFLVDNTGQNLVYLYRFHDDATWQLLSPTGSGRLAGYGVGSITAAGDIAGTVLGNGIVAYGPDGAAQPLVGLLSPAYQGGDSGDVVTGGTMTEQGAILARVVIGRSPRLVRLVPATPCATQCLRVPAIQMRGRFVPGPAGQGQCTPTSGWNVVVARVVVTSELGVRLGGVRVDGRFLDDYWTDRPLSAVTNAQGIATFSNRGPCGVGAVAFLIDDVTLDTRVLDRTRGVLAADVIPST